MLKPCLNILLMCLIFVHLPVLASDSDLDSELDLGEFSSPKVVRSSELPKITLLSAMDDIDLTDINEIVSRVPYDSPLFVIVPGLAPDLWDITGERLATLKEFLGRDRRLAIIQDQYNVRTIAFAILSKPPVENWEDNLSLSSGDSLDSAFVEVFVGNKNSLDVAFALNHLGELYSEVSTSWMLLESRMFGATPSEDPRTTWNWQWVSDDYQVGESYICAVN